MWFFFGIFTFIASAVWSWRTRLAAAWRGKPERIGGEWVDVREMLLKGGRCSVRLGAKAPAGLHFRVRDEWLQDRFFKWLGITSEIQTRDVEFDRKLFVESDAKAVAILLRRDAKLRSALVSIFEFADTWRMRKMNVRCVNRRLWLEFMLEPKSDLMSAKAYLAPLLHTISAGLESVDVPAEYKRDPFVWRAAGALAFSTGTAALGALGLARSISGRTDIIDAKLLFLACLVPALVITAVCAFALLAWLVGSSRTHTVVAEFVLVGGLGFVLGSHALAREANMDFDFEPATPVIVDIQTQDYVSTARSRAHYYYVHCDDWRKGQEGRRLRLEISSSTYGRLQDQRSATIFVKPGLFGFDWIEKIEPVRSPSQSR